MPPRHSNPALDYLLGEGEFARLNRGSSSQGTLGLSWSDLDPKKAFKSAWDHVRAEVKRFSKQVVSSVKGHFRQFKKIFPSNLRKKLTKLVIITAAVIAVIAAIVLIVVTAGAAIAALPFVGGAFAAGAVGGAVTSISVGTALMAFTLASIPAAIIAMTGTDKQKITMGKFNPAIAIIQSQTASGPVKEAAKRSVKVWGIIAAVVVVVLGLFAAWYAIAPKLANLDWKDVIGTVKDVFDYANKLGTPAAIAATAVCTNTQKKAEKEQVRQQNIINDLIAERNQRVAEAVDKGNARVLEEANKLGIQIESQAPDSQIAQENRGTVGQALIGKYLGGLLGESVSVMPSGAVNITKAGKLGGKAGIQKIIKPEAPIDWNKELDSLTVGAASISALHQSFKALQECRDAEKDVDKQAKLFDSKIPEIKKQIDDEVAGIDSQVDEALAGLQQIAQDEAKASSKAKGGMAIAVGALALAAVGGGIALLSAAGEES